MVASGCSPSDYRRIRRWEHEQILEAMQRRLDRKPDAMTIRRSTVEHVPDGGLSLDRGRWIVCRSDFFLPVRELSRLFRRASWKRSPTPTATDG